MLKKQVRLRNYPMADDQVSQNAREMRDLFLTDEEKFIAFDPDYGGDFAQTWLSDIVASEEAPSDEEVLGEQVSTTADINNVMKQCQSKVQIVKRYVLKSFANKKSVLKKYGFDNYDKVKNSQTGMYKFMKNLHKAAKKDAAVLIENKYTQEQIDEILTLANSLVQLNETQEGKKSDRPLATRDRIELNNTVWAKTSMVYRDGKIIFKDDPIKLKQYTYNTNSIKTESAPPVPQNP